MPSCSPLTDCLKYYGYELGALTNYDKKSGEHLFVSIGMFVQHWVCAVHRKNNRPLAGGCSAVGRPAPMLPPRARRQLDCQRRARCLPPVGAAGGVHQEVSGPVAVFFSPVFIWRPGASTPARLTSRKPSSLRCLCLVLFICPQVCAEQLVRQPHTPALPVRVAHPPALLASTAAPQVCAVLLVRQPRDGDQDPQALRDHRAQVQGLRLCEVRRRSVVMLWDLQ